MCKQFKKRANGASQVWTFQPALSPPDVPNPFIDNVPMQLYAANAPGLQVAGAASNSGVSRQSSVPHRLVPAPHAV